MPTRRAGEPPVCRAATVGAVLLLAGSIAAQAAEIRMLVSPGFGPVMRELGPRFERATGHRLAVSSDSLGAIIKRVGDGESFDVVLGPRTGIDGFVRDGRAPAGSVTVVASAGMAVAVRKGAPRPDISSPEAFRRALLAARSIAYPDPGTSAGNPALGRHMTRVLDRLGIADAMKPKTIFSSTLDVAGLVTSGEAELGIQQIQNLARSGTIEIVGPLPDELQDPVVFAAAIMAGATDVGASQALVAFMLTPEAAPVIEAHRMTPVTRKPRQ